MVPSAPVRALAPLEGIVLVPALTPDVPLGPFADLPVTVWSAKSRPTRLHTGRTCTSLRTATVVQSTVLLNAAAIKQMCPSCLTDFPYRYRQGTALGLFLQDLGGAGLQMQLGNYLDDDEDDPALDEIQAAAALLTADEPFQPADSGQDEDLDGESDDAETLRAAEAVREVVFDSWRRAAASLKSVEQILPRYDWLAAWAAPRAETKRRHLETLQSRAAGLVRPANLALCALVSLAAAPELPVEDPRVLALGDAKEVQRRWSTAWREWQEWVMSDWGNPEERSAPALAERGRGRRSVSAREADDLAADLVRGHLAQARQNLQESADGAVDLMVRIVEPEPRPGREAPGFLEALSPWERAVLVTWGVEFDWPAMTVRLQAPVPVAARLRKGNDWIRPEEVPVGAEAPSKVTPLTLGVFDDTPVHQRQLLALDHLRALRSHSRRTEQLCIVLSAVGGVETLPLAVVEQRCKQGWQGVLLATADDLPLAVTTPYLSELRRDSHADADVPRWTDDPFDPSFAADFSAVAGDRMLLGPYLGSGTEEEALRALALARNVTDLRILGRERSGSDRRSALPVETWQALLSTDQLDLDPFRLAGDGNNGREGSGLPTGPLSGVQLYSLHANPRYQGKGHAPSCQHADMHGQALTEAYERLSVADLLSTDYDWCGKCGGYAVRRFDDAQLAYYRLAHQYHYLHIRLTCGQPRPAELAEIADRLESLTDRGRDLQGSWQTVDRWDWKSRLAHLRTILAAQQRERRVDPV